MKRMLLILIFIVSGFKGFSSITALPFNPDTLDIKTWTKNDFINKFGFNDSALALINLFFTKNKRGKNQTIIGSAFFIGGVAAICTPFELGNDAKDFGEFVRPVAEPGAITLGSILTISGISKLKRFSRTNLYSVLLNYKNGNPIPAAYKKRLKQKFFTKRRIITPRF